MHKATLRDRLRYRFDNTMSRGTMALIVWLAFISMAMILVVAAVVCTAGLAPKGEDGSPLPFVQVAWMSLMRTLDAGTMGGDQGSWAFLMSMFAVTMGGIFLVSTLIGVLTSGIEQRIERLRKGRSLVAERDHTVILGWSPQIFSIISELVIANQTRKKGACIAILADKDKVEMEDEIDSAVPDTKNTKIVCRTGTPIDLSDLEIVSPHTSRAIIALAPEGQNQDSHIIKTILAITNNANRRSEPYHIVAVMQEERNLEVARMVGGKEVEIVLAGDLISRITVQTCRQSGLSVVHTELLDFDGDEIYIKHEPSLTGKTFGESLFHYEESSLMGLARQGGEVMINPPMDTVIDAKDRMIVVSRDDEAITLVPPPRQAVDESLVREPRRSVASPERTLIFGWNCRARTIVTQLDAYVAAGSKVTILADAENISAEIDRLSPTLKHLTLELKRGDTTDRSTLDQLEINLYDHLIVLGYSNDLDVQQADARTLVTLLHLRDIGEKRGLVLPIVSEMLDIRNRQLAEVTHADDFIVSDKLISLMLSQLSENKELAGVFANLFDPEGSEIYLKPAREYVETGKELCFYTVVEAAKRRGEVALGYRVKASATDAKRQYGVRVNPKKSERFILKDEDKIIVLAES
ncbi:MAG: potassium transporter TrkA [Myxococcota bacterium]|nr:potassium transporter TrkA [Myxococcota bacterium]